MARYTLTVTDYESKLTKIIPVLEEGESVEKTQLSTIDLFLLENFSNRDELKAFLNDKGYNISNNYSFNIVYKYNGEQKLPLIFGDRPEFQYFAHQLGELKALYNSRSVKDQATKNKIMGKIKQDDAWRELEDVFLNSLLDKQFVSFLSKKMDSHHYLYISQYIANIKQETNYEIEAYRDALRNIEGMLTSYTNVRKVLLRFEEYNLAYMKNIALNDKAFTNRMIPLKAKLVDYKIKQPETEVRKYRLDNPDLELSEVWTIDDLHEILPRSDYQELVSDLCDQKSNQKKIQY